METKCRQRLDRTFNMLWGPLSNYMALYILAPGIDCLCDNSKHPAATRREQKYLKTGVKASSSSGYRRKELYQNIASGTALHHPRKDPSKSNQETPINGCRL